MRILVVEDDELIVQALVAILSNHNYAVEVARDGEAAWSLIEAFHYDLLLLDVMLPKCDGISLCRLIRSHHYQMPILLLTGRDSGHDKAIGLDAGADDYVVKPFDAEELVARIRALLRRSHTTTPPVLKWDKLLLDPTSCEATYDQQPVALTAKEFALLELFLRNQRRVFSCSAILEHLWAGDEMPGEEAVRTHIKGLRQKLKSVGCPATVIETVYGIGYRLKPIAATTSPNGANNTANNTASNTANNTAKVTPASHQPSTPSEPQTPGSDPTRQQIFFLLEQTWNRHKNRIMQQIETLRQAVASGINRSLSQELYQQARQAAHTLAGSLGTFGFTEESHIAQEIEQRLQAIDPWQPDQCQLEREQLEREQPEQGQLNEGEQLAQLDQLVFALECRIARSSSLQFAHSEAAIHPNHRNSNSNSDSNGNSDSNPVSAHLLIIDDDPSLLLSLTAQAPTMGLQTEVIPSLEAAKTQIDRHPPHIVLLNPAISDNLAASLSFLNHLNQHQPPIPVIICTEQADLQERLEVARSGGRTLLQKPVSATVVLQMVDRVLQAERIQATVLIVDDDPNILQLSRTWLESWGFRVKTLDNPQQFWEILERTAPDLLILAKEMPQISGVELCQIVRNDSRWNSLPILFLMPDCDTNSIHQIFRAGADDFVSKPIVGTELVSRTINRLKRIEGLKQCLIRNRDGKVTLF